MKKTKKAKTKYFITVKQVATGATWEEELTSMYVTKDSPHFESHESGMHDIPKNLTEEQVEHYGKNLVHAFFNNTLREGESPREFIGYRIEK